jgi:fused signal recognition particle receptor
MDAPILLLVLAALVVVAGLAVIVASRRRGASVAARPAPEATAPTVPPVPPAPPVSPVPAASAAAGTAPEVPEADAAPPRAEPAGVSRGMGRSKAGFARVLGAIRQRGGVDDRAWAELEETLLRADVGVAVTDDLLGAVRGRLEGQKSRSADDLVDALRTEMVARLSGSDRSLVFDPERSPNVWLFVGVNGVGKTTSIGKIAAVQIAAGRSVLLAAGDTFRAAAAEQLETWAGRSGAQFVRGAEGGDPASVIYDGAESAAARGIDLVLADTAGRLQNKANLMAELAKVRRVADRGSGAVTEVLLVIDATTGQNGISQAREFAAATDVTGVVLTKLDGSAKGGVVFAVETTLGIPVKLVGVGEQIADLVTFDATDFVDALLE